MMRRGKWQKALAALSAITMMALATPVRAVEKLVYATYFSDIYAGSKTDIWFMEEVEKRSGGEIKFERYWANSLVKASDLFPGLKSGAVDVAHSAPHAYNVKEYPIAGVALPFISDKSDAMMFAWRDLYKNNAEFRAEFESKGVKGLYGFAWAENTLWSKRPIAKIADLKGLKVRAPPPMSEALLKLGATPVALAWTEGLEALQRGVVDGFSSAPFDSAVHGNAQDVAKFGSDLGGSGIFAVTVVGMSLQRYNGLSEKLRKVIDEVAAEATEKAVHFSDVSLDAAVAKLCGMKEKLQVNLFNDEDKATVQKLVVSTMQSDWIARVGKETKANGKAMLDEFVSYVRKYEPQSKYVPGFERYAKACGKG